VTQPSVRSIAPRSARIVYAALFAGSFGTAVILIALRAAFGPPGAAAAAGALRSLALGVVLLAALGVQLARRRIAPLAAGADEAAWWGAHLTAAVIVWALAESGVLAGAAIHFVTGDWVALAAAAGALFLLWGARPGRLLEG
jgi:hypothetical protein